MFLKKVNTNTGLRTERSINCSGVLLNKNHIPELLEKDYFVKSFKLDGDAPKQFIKAYFHGEAACLKRHKPNSWCGYIAKTAEKWYPVESVMEYMMNRIGQVLGLDMNTCRLVQANGQIRFLSRYFRGENERLVHGAEICGAYLEDMSLAEEIANHKKSARELFTFQFVTAAIQSVYPEHSEILILQLAKMIAFDAITGNDDRHFYNWGVLDSSIKTKKPPKFAPLYDSARGLLWNWSDDNIAANLRNHFTGGRKIVKYIQAAAPRISIEGNSAVNHFELLAFLRRFNPDYATIINEMTAIRNEEAVLKMLEREFYGLFVRQRCEAITLILKERFNQIRRL